MRDPEYHRRYRQEHRERLRAADRERQAARTAEQIEAERARTRAYYAEHRETAIQRATDWNLAHPERAAERRRTWTKRHPDRVRAARWRSNEQRRGTRPTGAARDYTLILANDPCSYCGKPAEQIDHIVPVALGGAGEWDNLTAACGDCNRAKSAKPLLGFLAARVT